MDLYELGMDLADKKDRQVQDDRNCKNASLASDPPAAEWVTIVFCVFDWQCFRIPLFNMPYNYIYVYVFYVPFVFRAINTLFVYLILNIYSAINTAFLSAKWQLHVELWSVLHTYIYIIQVRSKLHEVLCARSRYQISSEGTNDYITGVSWLWLSAGLSPNTLAIHWRHMSVLSFLATLNSFIRWTVFVFKKNIEQQMSAPDSLLKWIKRSVWVRRLAVRVHLR